MFVQTEIMCQPLKLVPSPFASQEPLVQKWKHEKLCLQCGPTFTFVSLSRDLDIRIPSWCQTVPNLLISLPRYHKHGALLHRLWKIKLISLILNSSLIRGDQVKQFILHTTLDPQEADCAPTMNHFQLILELRRDRSLLPTDGMTNAMENPACLGQSSFIVKAEGPCCRTNTMRISGLWPCPILPLLFSEGKFGKSQFPGVPGLPRDVPAGQDCEGRGKAQQLSVEAAPLDGACLKSS